MSTPSSPTVPAVSDPASEAAHGDPPASPAAEFASPAAAFVSLLADALARDTFRGLVLGGPRQAAASGRRVSLRRIDLRGVPTLSFVSHHATRDVTENLSIADGLTRVTREVGDHFANGHLQTADEDIECRVSKRGRVHIVRRATAARSEGVAPARTHDRPRHRIVDPDSPYLVELGITDAAHRLVPAMARKWKQINKFVEILDHAIDGSPLRDAASIKVVDFGCGKGYLTFAAHAHLRQRFGAVEVVGVELRADLVEGGNRAAGRVGADAAGLRFVVGDLRSFDPGTMDVMVALHACDTATDHALDLGLRAGAALLVAAPCCHQELRPQMNGPSALSPLFRHGVHLGQEAEMVTDSLRALLLEACGYDARVFEFVTLEHTRKNKMILATRRPAEAPTRPALAEVEGVKDFYGLREQCLEKLLRERGALAA